MVDAVKKATASIMRELEAKLDTLDAKLNTWKAKAEELKAQGKSKEEITAIIDKMWEDGEFQLPPGKPKVDWTADLAGIHYLKNGEPTRPFSTPPPQ